jgi:hypothetical protein
MSAKTTTDHDEIRTWVEARGGCPAHVKGTGRRRSDPGVLRIDYEGFGGVKTLEPMEWDEWFASFDAHKLAFLYDTDKKSRFSKLISRTTAKKRTTAKRTTAKRTTAKARATPKKRTTTAKKRTTTAKRRAARA